jgi:hypothetical protein
MGALAQFFENTPDRLTLALFSFPALCVGVPNAVGEQAIGEQAIEIGQVWITVDAEAQAWAIVLAREGFDTRDLKEAEAFLEELA